MSAPSYEFYVESYHHGRDVGIPEDDWADISAQADDEVAFFERVYTVTDPTEDGTGRDGAVCAVADQMYTYEVIASSELSVNPDGTMASTSVSIGSVSTSAKSPNTANLGLDMSESGQAKTYLALISKYLDVYRGMS